MFSAFLTMKEFWSLQNHLKMILQVKIQKVKKLHLMYVAHPATRGTNFRAAYTFVNCQFFELRP